MQALKIRGVAQRTLFIVFGQSFEYAFYVYNIAEIKLCKHELSS